MQLKQVHYEDVLTNILVKSKSILEEVTKGDHKMNYRKRYDNPKQFEVSYIDALANLEEINELFKKRINNKNKHYNFFLDNSDNPLIEKAIEPQLYNQYLNHIKNGKIYAYTLENTWTKGKQFFFIKKGSVMSVVKIYQDRIFVDVKYHGSVGLMKIEDLKIILQDHEDIQQIQE